MQDMMGIVCRNFDKLEEYVVHPREFSTLLHLYGLNINSLHTIYKKVENAFIKQILKTEATVRSFKMLYRKKMQDSTINTNQPE